MTNKNIVNTQGLLTKQNLNSIKYNTVFDAVEKLINKNKPIIIAIEGRCGSGKSTLAALLAEIFDCNIFHMDDFFLPFEMKTKQRLAKAGGNVHYERFLSEVAENLKKYKPVTYHSYNCMNRTLSKPICVNFKKLTIIEGSYSMHPTLQEIYDYSIFLTLDPQVQIQRIRERNGYKMLQNFINKWIPMEEHYFSTLNIKEHCNIIINTSVT